MEELNKYQDNLEKIIQKNELDTSLKLQSNTDAIKQNKTRSDAFEKRLNEFS